MEYSLLKSRRRTISVEVRNGEVIVRAPNRISKREADAFVLKHTAWIKKQLQKYAEEQAAVAAVRKLSDEEIEALYERAKAYIPSRVAYYADMLGEEYRRITIRCQRTRWGSCSVKRNLNFNCLLMLAPPMVIDSVVAHEVCHLREMNHSARFYTLLLSIFPEYRTHDKWLKENGKMILARVKDGGVQ